MTSSRIHPVLSLIRFLRDMPIRQKAMLVVMSTTTVAIITAGLGILAADSYLFRRSLQTDLTALAHIIADNTTASLAFNDPGVGTETLATLRARTHVVAACLFSSTGEVFAQYIRPGSTQSCPPPEPGNKVRVQDKTYYAFRAVTLKDRPLGTLVVVYDLGESGERLELFGATVFAVLLLSTLLALLLSSRLRSFLTTPIVELARLATRVSQTRDYHLRAQRASRDELGLLVDGFNDMLASIQSRDSELHAALIARSSALQDAQKARESLETSLRSVAQLNEELRRSNENLARSNEDLERFAFIASHDLQEPLRMISIHLQLLTRNYSGALDEKARGWIKVIENGAVRMRALLSDLLAYAEIGAPSDVPLQTLDLNSAVRTAAENLSAAITESGAVVSAAELPVIMGFESHFVPLFQNLIGNAIKYRSTEPPRVQMCLSSDMGHIEISVADNGIGIAPEYYSKIFAPFKRLHGNKIPGTGIGLAICQRVVEKYGGRIWVESAVGQGSKFIFTLPLTVLAIAPTHADTPDASELEIR